jgi:hypothetical protein
MFLGKLQHAVGHVEGGVVTLGSQDMVDTLRGNREQFSVL